MGHMQLAPFAVLLFSPPAVLSHPFLLLFSPQAAPPAIPESLVSDSGGISDEADTDTHTDNPLKAAVRTDGDDIPDSFDSDSDGDGIPDALAGISTFGFWCCLIALVAVVGVGPLLRYMLPTSMRAQLFAILALLLPLADCDARGSMPAPCNSNTLLNEFKDCSVQCGVLTNGDVVGSTCSSSYCGTDGICCRQGVNAGVCDGAVGCNGWDCCVCTTSSTHNPTAAPTTTPTTTTAPTTAPTTTPTTTPNATCSVCPEYEVFSRCPTYGGNQAGCNADAGCEWCSNQSECRVLCTCNDDSSPTPALFRDCSYVNNESTAVVSFWPPLLAPPYSAYPSNCSCADAPPSSPHPTHPDAVACAFAEGIATGELGHAQVDVVLTLNFKTDHDPCFGSGASRSTALANMVGSKLSSYMSVSVHILENCAEDSQYNPTRPVTDYNPTRPVTDYNPTRPVTDYNPTRPVTDYNPTRPVTDCNPTRPAATDYNPTRATDYNPTMPPCDEYANDIFAGPIRLLNANPNDSPGPLTAPTAGTWDTGEIYGMRGSTILLKRIGEEAFEWSVNAATAIEYGLIAANTGGANPEASGDSAWTPCDADSAKRRLQDPQQTTTWEVVVTTPQGQAVAAESELRSNFGTTAALQAALAGDPAFADALVVSAPALTASLLLPPPSPPPPPTASSKQDPHLSLAHGGRADFRGRGGAYYNFLSAPGVSVNVRFDEALFTLHDGRLLVNGTFITEVHIAALVSGTNKCKWANVSYVAKELNAQNWGWRSVKGTCGGRAFILGPNAAKSCRGLRASVKVSTATVEVAPLATSIEGPMWRVVVRGNMVYGRVAGPYHRLDLAISRTESAVPPAAHGLIGQSFSGTAPRVGNLDHYPDEGVFTTAAQAEGAIEGSGEMYQVRSPFSTDFAFSRFGAPSSAANEKGSGRDAVAMCDAALADEIATANTRARRVASDILDAAFEGWRRFTGAEGG